MEFLSNSQLPNEIIQNIGKYEPDSRTYEINRKPLLIVEWYKRANMQEIHYGNTVNRIMKLKDFLNTV